MEQIKVMDFCARLGANHSDSWSIERICNDVWRKKNHFYVPLSPTRYTGIDVTVSQERDEGSQIPQMLKKGHL